MADTTADTQARPKTPHPLLEHSMWVVVADRTQARILGRENRDFQEIYAFQAPRHLDDGLNNNTIGRGGAYGAGRHKYEPAMEESRQTELALARNVAKYLETAHARRQYSELAIVAAPRMLGELRNAMPSVVLKTLVSECDKDIVQLDGQQLREALLAVLPGPDRL